jgi:hypothetical protein
MIKRTIILFDKETWEFVNSFAPWLSAFATIAVVIVSLYFSRRDKKIRIEISAGYRLIISQGDLNNRPEYLNVHIVNIGHREVQIVNIGWKIGFIKKKYFIQKRINNDGLSSPMPIRLRDGDEANYYIPLNDETNWIDNLIEKRLQPHPKMNLNFMKLQVFTSVGNEFNTKIEKGLKKRILENLK